MNIAIIADPSIPVPPTLYGGIERIVDMLIIELTNRGHQITLFAHKDSRVPCNFIPYGRENNSFSSNLFNASTINKRLLFQKFDLIHSFGRMAHLLPQLPLNIPKLVSYQREPTTSQIKRAIKISKRGTLSFTGCSDYITNQITPFAPAFTVYNGVDTTKYIATNEVSKDAPLIFLGRIEPIKGAHLAVEIALKTGKKLKIAGNIPVDCRSYFDEQIKPFLSNQIEYVGPVNDQQKAELLRGGLALLMPINWNEPFGIVMIEAMACGTPVIGFGKGAVPEVVDHNFTGFYGNTLTDLLEYVEKVHVISREKVRHMVEKKFSHKIITDNYVQVYEKLINKSGDH